MNVKALRTNSVEFQLLTFNVPLTRVSSDYNLTHCHISHEECNFLNCEIYLRTFAMKGAINDASWPTNIGKWVNLFIETH